MNSQQLKGIIPAVITPMTSEGEIDKELFIRQVDYLVSSGASGLFINGTSGEGAYLRTDEKNELLALAENTAGNRAFICAAVLKSNLKDTMEELLALDKSVVDYYVAISPYYYSVDQDVIKQHFLSLADISPRPLLLYNIPSCTHNTLEIETVRELSSHPNIAGMKDSSGNFADFSRGLIEDMDKEFTWIQGEDYLDAPSLLIGGEAIVSGLSNINVKPYVEMYKASCSNNTNAVREAQRQINKLYESFMSTGYGNIPFIKAACEILGRGSRWMRQPGMSLNKEAYQKVEQILDKMDIIK